MGVSRARGTHRKSLRSRWPNGRHELAFGSTH